MADQIKKLLSEAVKLIKKKNYDEAQKLIEQALELDGDDERAQKMFYDLYALQLDKNMRDNVDGYEQIIKKELGDGWSEIQDLWQKFAKNKISYGELTDKAYKKKYKNSSFREVSEAIRKAQLVFIEGQIE